MTTTTDTGVADTTEVGGVANAAEALLARFLPEKTDAASQSSEKKQVETPEPSEPTEEHETTEETSDESPEGAEGDEGSEENDQQVEKKYVDNDEAFVKIKVGDEELEVPVKDLKRLHGQEAALTRKSQEVADQRKAVEAQQTQYAAKLDRMVKAATAKADEFRKLNFFALAKDPNISAEQLNILETEARKAFEEETFLKGDLKEFVDAVQKDQQTKLADTARETVKVLSDEKSPLHIKGWNQTVYNDLRSFAKELGVPANIVDNLVDAPSLKILHMALMYKKGASKVSTQAVNKTAKKIVKTTRTSAPSSKPVAEQQKAMKVLKKAGRVQDAANAFLAGWATDED
jgi:hypothetical protein